MNPQTLALLFAQLMGAKANAGEQALGTAAVNAMPETGDAAVATNLFNNAVDMQIPMSDATADKFNTLYGDGTGFSNAKYDVGSVINPNWDFGNLDAYATPAELLSPEYPNVGFVHVPDSTEPYVENLYSFPSKELVNSFATNAGTKDAPTDYRPHQNTALGRWFDDRWTSVPLDWLADTIKRRYVDLNGNSDYTTQWFFD